VRPEWEESRSAGTASGTVCAIFIKGNGGAASAGQTGAAEKYLISRLENNFTLGEKKAALLRAL
jgi:hypothetical protein